MSDNNDMAAGLLLLSLLGMPSNTVNDIANAATTARDNGLTATSNTPSNIQYSTEDPTDHHITEEDQPQQASNIDTFFSEYNRNIELYQRTIDSITRASLITPSPLLNEIHQSYNEQFTRYQRNITARLNRINRTTPDLTPVREPPPNIIPPPIRRERVIFPQRSLLFPDIGFDENSSTADTDTNNYFGFRNRNSGDLLSQTLQNTLNSFDIEVSRLTDLYVGSPQLHNARRTDAEIEEIIENIPYDDSLRGELCPISWEEFVDNKEICKIRQCGHTFNKTNLFTWLRTNNHCPVCRCELLPPLASNGLDLSMNDMFRHDASMNFIATPTRRRLFGSFNR